MARTAPGLDGSPLPLTGPVAVPTSRTATSSEEKVPEALATLTAVPDADPVDALARAVLRVLQAGNGRSNRCEVSDELPHRLIADGAAYTPTQLSEALTRLEDCGLIQRVQRTGHPVFMVRSGAGTYDSTDVLAASVCAVLKRRQDRFEDEDQLVRWLMEDQISYDAHGLAVALAQLERMVG